MKRALVIILAFISCFAAEAQLRTIKPSKVIKVPDISYATYERNTDYYMESGSSQLFNELYDPGDNWYNCANVGTPVASSYLSSQGSQSYKPSHLHDFNHETAWVEGVSGYGVGQWVEYRFPAQQTKVTKIKILNGYVKSYKAWNENARVKRLKVYYNGKAVCILDLQNSRSMQIFNVGTLGNEYNAWKLRFEILDVYPGTKYKDTVISEIIFDGIGCL